jgi:hypothetical protein
LENYDRLFPERQSFYQQQSGRIAMLVRFLISAIVGLLSYAVLNSLRQKGVCSSVRLGSLEAEGDYGGGGFSPLDVEIDRNNARSTFLFLSYVPSVANNGGNLGRNL